MSRLARVDNSTEYGKHATCPRAPILARASLSPIGKIMTHAHITRPAFTLDNAIAGLLLQADCHGRITSKVRETDGYIGVRPTEDGPAYVLNSKGAVLGLKRGETLSPEIRESIAAAYADKAFIPLDYHTCSKAHNIVATAQDVADDWASLDKFADVHDETKRLVGAVQSAVKSRRKGVSKPAQIRELLTDPDDETAEASLTRLTSAVKGAAKVAHKAPAQRESKSITVKATEAVLKVADAIRAGDIIPDAELNALKGALAQVSAAEAERIEQSKSAA